MAHDAMIALHALAGVIAFTAGAASLGLVTPASWRLRTYLAGLVGLVSFMVAAVAVDWAEKDPGTRAMSTALVALGVYMLWRAGKATARLRRRAHGWRPRYVDDVGFTLISLFDGFVIVGAIDLGAPGWLVALVAVAGVFGGVASLRRVKARLVAAAPGGPRARPSAGG